MVMTANPETLNTITHCNNHLKAQLFESLEQSSSLGLKAAYVQARWPTE